MLRLFTAFVALIAGLAFHSRNHQPVPLDFYIARIGQNLALINSLIDSFIDINVDCIEQWVCILQT